MPTLTPRKLPPEEVRSINLEEQQWIGPLSEEQAAAASSNLTRSELDAGGIRAGKDDRSEAAWREHQRQYQQSPEARDERLAKQSPLKTEAGDAQRAEDEKLFEKTQNLQKRADKFLKEHEWKDRSADLEGFETPPGGEVEEVYSVDPREDFVRNVRKNLTEEPRREASILEGKSSPSLDANLLGTRGVDLPTATRESPDKIPDKPKSDKSWELTDDELVDDIEELTGRSDVTILGPEHHIPDPPKPKSSWVEMLEQQRNTPIEEGTTTRPSYVQTQAGPEYVGPVRKRPSDVLSYQREHREDYNKWVESFPPEKRHLLHRDPEAPDKTMPDQSWRVTGADVAYDDNLSPQDRKWLLEMKAQGRWPFKSPITDEKARHAFNYERAAERRNIFDMRALARQRWRESPEGREAWIRKMLRQNEDVRDLRKSHQEGLSEGERRAIELQDLADETPELKPEKPKAPYEVSTRGDRRFSALNAKLSTGQTVEQAYQSAKGTGKGRPAKDPDFDYYGTYKKLWDQWADENPDLIEELAEIAKTHELKDSFARTENNQAKALTDIIRERFGDE